MPTVWSQRPSAVTPPNSSAPSATRGGDPLPPLLELRQGVRAAGGPRHAAAEERREVADARDMQPQRAGNPRGLPDRAQLEPGAGAEQEPADREQSHHGA